MANYESMFIIKPDLSEQDRQTLFNQINDAVTKNNGSVISGSVWAEKRKLCFPIKKHNEGSFYLLNFSLLGPLVKEISHAYKLNENILRFMVTKQG
ncbi:MAG: 30S ribosomal protein S6 [Candidatus Omnitrophota bacterium]